MKQSRNKSLPKKVIEELKSLHQGKTAHTPAEKLTRSGISTKVYPPYPRNKLLYYDIIQTAINKANAAGYEEGLKTARERCQEDTLNKMIKALCIVSTALAERKY